MGAGGKGESLTERQKFVVTFDFYPDLGDIGRDRLVGALGVDHQHRVFTLLSQQRQGRAFVRVADRRHVRQHRQGPVDAPGFDVVAQAVGRLDQGFLRPQGMAAGARAQRRGRHRLFLPG